MFLITTNLIAFCSLMTLVSEPPLLQDGCSVSRPAADVNGGVTSVPLLPTHTVCFLQIALFLLDYSGRWLPC